MILKRFPVCLFLFLFHIGCAQTVLQHTEKTIWCGSTNVTFQTSCADPQPGIQFIHVHENEKTAVEAANKMLLKYGKGCFTTWRAMDDRYVSFDWDSCHYKFDPNRIYTIYGRMETIRNNGDYTETGDAIVTALADSFLINFVDSQRLIVALHNNTDNGDLNIKGYKRGGAYEKDAAKVHIQKGKDIDDFFFTTDDRIYEYLKAKKFNIMLQDNNNVADDGSLSVYAAFKFIPYVNIEAEHGHLKEQMEMIDAVQEMIADLFPG